MLSDGVSSRRATEEDEPFIKALFSAIRAPEFLPLRLPEAELTALLDMQYRAMRSHYSKAFPDATYSIIFHENQPIGYEAVNDEPASWHLIDVALLPEFRGRGIGTARLEALKDVATQSGKGIYLYVEGNNPAKGLYERLGFRVTGEEGIHRRMVWEPEA